MTEPLRVGQFGIVDHEPVDRSPNAGVFQGKGPTDDRAELFIVAEGTTPAGEEYAGHVVSGVGNAWAHLDMSVTGALRRLFVEAQGHVRDWNKKSVAQHRVNLGLTCFARKSGYSVIAQAGPTVAFHLRDGRVTAYMPEGEAAAPIGADEPVKPQLARINFLPGDRLLIFSTAALASVDEELIGGILTLPGSQVLQDLYRRVEHLRHLTVVLIEAPPAEVPASPDDEAEQDDDNGPIIGGKATGNSLHSRKALQPSLFVDALDEERHRAVEAAREKLTHLPERRQVAAELAQEEAEELAPLQRVVGDSRLAHMAMVQRERASASSLAAVSAAAVAAEAHSRPSWRAYQEERAMNAAGDGIVPTSASFGRSLVRDRSYPRPDPNVSEAPLPTDIVATRRKRAAQPVDEDVEEDSHYEAMPLVRPRNTMGGRWRANGSLSRRTGVPTQAPSTRFVVAIGLVLLIGLVGFLALPRLMDSNNGGRAAELLEAAEQQLAAARVQNDPALQRNALTEAQVLVLEAEQIGGTTTDSQSLMNEVGNAITALDAVREPARVEVIASLESYGDGAVTPADVSVGPSTAYLLDTTGSQVIAQPLDGTNPSTIYQENAEAGQGRPIAVAYYRSALDPDGGRLLIADSESVLWSYTPGDGASQVELNLPDGSKLTDIATYNGELYILDAPAGTIYRMTGIDDSFPYEPQVVREGSDLRSAVRMFVDDEIVTSSTSGSLQRYSGELALELSQAGIDRRLSQPASPWATEDGHLAIADPANNRIAVFHRDGTFVRQYRHADFGSLAAMGMRDNAGFVFAGGKLLRVTWED